MKAIINGLTIEICPPRDILSALFIHSNILPGRYAPGIGHLDIWELYIYIYKAVIGSKTVSLQSYLIVYHTTEDNQPCIMMQINVQSSPNI